jgi:hypothetical protein
MACIEKIEAFTSKFLQATHPVVDNSDDQPAFILKMVLHDIRVGLASGGTDLPQRHPVDAESPEELLAGCDQ